MPRGGVARSGGFAGEGDKQLDKESSLDRASSYWAGRGAGEPVRVGFLLVPGFSLISFGAVVDPLRLANMVARKTLYQCELLAKRWIEE